MPGVAVCNVVGSGVTFCETRDDELLKLEVKLDNRLVTTELDTGVWLPPRPLLVDETPGVTSGL